MDSNETFALGSVLAGSLLSAFLFGFLCLQTFLYVKQYPNDPKHLKALVFLVWQVVHSTRLVCKPTPIVRDTGLWTHSKRAASYYFPFNIRFSTSQDRRLLTTYLCTSPERFVSSMILNFSLTVQNSCGTSKTAETRCRHPH
ncbi:hypothetical protein BJV77DRAFT_193132 [Russula vinacea]|nr:hypothetical protein BJV77DRAFT_193132 [Russula vinacea]